MQRNQGDEPVEQNNDFASLLAQYLDESEGQIRPERGDLVYGTVVSVTDKEVMLDIGAKRDGIVPSSDLSKLDAETRATLTEGARVPAVVLHPNNQDGELILSVYLSQQEHDWIMAQELLDSGGVAEQEVVGYNKGGLTVSFGSIRGFVPASHIPDFGRSADQDRQGRLAEYVGEKLPVKVIEVDRRRRRLVLSYRLADQEVRAQRKIELLDTLEVGQILSGTVTAIRNFGVFVDLGGADGLIHLSELDWYQVKHPRDVVEVGDEVTVQVLRLDESRQRIALSRRRALPNPWDTIAQRYQPDQTVPARVTKLMEFGAFAELEPGIEGLIHISELADHPIRHPREVLQVDQEITVFVLRVEPERQRIGLSIRRAAGGWVVADAAHDDSSFDLIENEYEDEDEDDN